MVSHTLQPDDGNAVVNNEKFPQKQDSLADLPD